MKKWQTKIQKKKPDYCFSSKNISSRQHSYYEGAKKPDQKKKEDKQNFGIAHCCSQAKCHLVQNSDWYIKLMALVYTGDLGQDSQIRTSCSVNKS